MLKRKKGGGIPRLSGVKESRLGTQPENTQEVPGRTPRSSPTMPPEDSYLHGVKVGRRPPHASRRQEKIRYSAKSFLTAGDFGRPTFPRATTAIGRVDWRASATKGRTHILRCSMQNSIDTLHLDRPETKNRPIRSINRREPTRASSAPPAVRASAAWSFSGCDGRFWTM